MALNVLIIPDKFKGTLTAHAAAQAIARGWRARRSCDTLDLVPMSDGGDGFGEVMSSLLGAQPQITRTVDAAHRPCRARWWWASKSRIAVVESAEVIGLAMLPRGKFHPFQLDTFGLGAILKAAALGGARLCLVGIGGSATNDGGFGLALSLGWIFLDKRGQKIEQWSDLRFLHHIKAPERGITFHVPRFALLVAADVQNPLLGPRGATRVYGPQKGLEEKDFRLAEACLRQLACVVKEQFGYDASKEPGTGAAGGLGFGLRVFAGARLERGFELFAQQAELNRRLRKADLVVAGEGSVDASSLMGKGVGEIARRCKSAGVPCFCIAGRCKKDARLIRAFSHIAALTELTTEAQAMKRPAHWLAKAAAKAEEKWNMRREA